MLAGQDYCYLSIVVPVPVPVAKDVPSLSSLPCFISKYQGNKDMRLQEASLLSCEDLISPRTLTNLYSHRTKNVVAKENLKSRIIQLITKLN